MTHYLEKLRVIFKYYKKPINVIISYLLNKDIYLTLKNSNITIKTRKGSGLISALPLLSKKGWKISSFENMYLFEKDGIKLVQPNHGVLLENLEIYHCFDFKNKNVLDIGGFFGETAILFKKWGAAKVLVFEPLPFHLKILHQNIRVNNLENSVKLYPYAVGDKEGYTILSSTAKYGSGFGLHEGKYKVRVKTISWENVLKMAKEENINIIKVDCEGCEKYLKNVPDILINYFDKWIIELHSKEIIESLNRKFKSFRSQILERVESEVIITKFYK